MSLKKYKTNNDNPIDKIFVPANKFIFSLILKNRTIKNKITKTPNALKGSILFFIKTELFCINNRSSVTNIKTNPIKKKSEK